MSAQPIEKSPTEGLGPDEGPQDGLEGPTPERGGAPEQIEVRHQAAVSLLLGVATSAIAIAYLWRAASTGAAFDWLLCATLAVLSVGLFRNLLDARLPLLVADELGVRFRLGRQWRGLPWEAVDRIVVSPRRGLLRDGRLVVNLHHMHRAIEGIEGRARRHARLNQKMYGAVLAVPLGLTTRITHATEENLQERFAELAHGRADVVTLLPEPEPVPAARRPDHDAVTTAPAADAVDTEPESHHVIGDDEQPPVADRRPRWLRRGSVQEEPAETSDIEESAGTDGEEGTPTYDVPGVAEPQSPAALATEHEGVRPLGAEAAALPTQSTPLTAPLAHAASSKVRAIARLGEPVAPLVIEDFEPHPAYDPVIGPDLAAARTRVGLSVDELADRTRIRPHVIESIEVDDFTPCGGDFYARGHIRTLARVLGKDPAPMLAAFDSRYATAPISPRRVFEAELATGLTGSMRSTRGGPNWALMIGAVLTLVLVWSAVRLFSVDSETAFETPPPVLNGSSGIGNGFGEPAAEAAVPAVETTLAAVQAGAGVEVRDGQGALVFEGDLVIGEVKTLRVSPPVTVTTDNGGAVSATVAGRDMGFLGEADQPATRVFQSPSR
jgi:cytoskeleton protein RodZ